MKTSEIYWGAVPFVLIQVVMVALVLAFPQLVWHAPGAGTAGIMEVPIEADPEASYLLPPEWK